VGVAALGVAIAISNGESWGRANPVLLSCRGEMTAMIRGTSEDHTVAVTIDPDARTVTVGSYGAVPILGDPNGDTVAFMADKENTDKENSYVSTGTINRLTGVASVDITTLTDELYKFYGICKPAQKLF
jgi:hypothetical protein